jgi:hypothetical protein
MVVRCHAIVDANAGRSILAANAISTFVTEWLVRSGWQRGGTERGGAKVGSSARDGKP